MIPKQGQIKRKINRKETEFYLKFAYVCNLKKRD